LTAPDSRSTRQDRCRVSNSTTGGVTESRAPVVQNACRIALFEQGGEAGRGREPVLGRRRSDAGVAPRPAVPSTVELARRPPYLFGDQPRRDAGVAALTVVTPMLSVARAVRG
jgi:hypothetical protein